jgi:hypothetical protein
MKPLNEFNTGYPGVISNAQSQEYQGALGPVDAETVQGNDRLNPKTPEGLHRINNFINHFFKRTTLNPQSDIAQLRVRLNHLTLDFPFDNAKPVEAVNNYVVTFGGSAFGATPTTDLSKGFDTGSDLARYNLQVRVIKTDGGFKLEGKLTAGNEITESILDKGRRFNRINNMKNIWENAEAAKAKRIKDPSGDTEKEINRDKKRVDRELKTKKR